MKTLSGLKELAEKATPGPWVTDLTNSVESWHSVRTKDIQICSFPVWSNPTGITACETRDNSNFIAAANPDTVIKLVEEVEKLRAALGLYANWSNWERGATINDFDEIQMTGDFQYGDDKYENEVVGGKTARIALTESQRRLP